MASVPCWKLWCQIQDGRCVISATSSSPKAGLLKAIRQPTGNGSSAIGRITKSSPDGKLESKQLRTAAMLTCIGQDVYDGLDFENDDRSTQGNRYRPGEAREVLHRCYKRNLRALHLQQTVTTGRWIDYVPALRSLAKSSNYGELTGNLIRDHIVACVRDNGIRKELLAEASTPSQTVLILRAELPNALKRQTLKSQSHGAVEGCKCSQIGEEAEQRSQRSEAKEEFARSSKA